MIKKPFELLDLPRQATPDEVKARWRALASEHHPDKGGDPTTFAHYRAAYQAALKLAEQPRECPVCHGDGYIRRGKGFNSVNVRCKACRGIGRAHVKASQ